MRVTTILLIIWCNVKIWTNKLFGNQFRLLPYKALVNLTNKCNSKCNFCDIWKEKDFDDEITPDHLLTMFDDMGRNLVWLALSGGEVTLVKYVAPLLVEAKKRCKNLKIISFTTNGLLPEKVVKLSEEIIAAGFDLIETISLDGDKELHDELRGVPGNYDKCISLYNSLKAKSINVNYGITVNGANHSYILSEYRKMRHEIKAITFVHDGGIYKKSNNTDKNIILNSMRHIFKEYTIDSISEIIEYIHIKIAVHFIAAQEKKNLIPCEVITTSVHVMPDGEVQPCMYLKSLGNIKNKKFSEIIFNEKTDSIKREIKNNKCPHCWMNCYSPYSIMQHPFSSIKYLFKRCN